MQQVDYRRKNTIYQNGTMTSQVMTMLRVQGLRIAWFSSDLATGDAAKVFGGLFRQEPDRSSSAKAPTPQNPFLETVGGEVGPYNVEIQRQIGRLDLLLSPVASDEEQGEGIPKLVDLEEIAPFVLSALGQGEGFPNSQRIALVTTAMELLPSVEDARSAFSGYLVHDFAIQDASDHFFQVNRRIVLGGKECNRVVQVGVALFQGLHFAVGPIGTVQNVVNSSHALTVTHDFNSVPTEVFKHPSEQLLVFAQLLEETARAFAVGNINFLQG